MPWSPDPPDHPAGRARLILTNIGTRWAASISRQRRRHDRIRDGEILVSLKAPGNTSRTCGSSGDSCPRVPPGNVLLLAADIVSQILTSAFPRDRHPVVGRIGQPGGGAPHRPADHIAAV